MEIENKLLGEQRCPHCDGRLNRGTTIEGPTDHNLPSVGICYHCAGILLCINGILMEFPEDLLKTWSNHCPDLYEKLMLMKTVQEKEIYDRTRTDSSEAT